MIAMRYVGVAAVAGLLLGGCTQQCPKASVPMDQLVAEYNANAQKAPQLYARVEISLHLVAPDGRASDWSGDGTLLMEKGDNKLGPHYFVVSGRESGQDLFRLGCDPSDDVYYLWYHFGGKGQLWRGRQSVAGAPGVRMPLDPNQLLSVLAITQLPDDFRKLPTVCMTLQDDPGTRCAPRPCSYVLTYIDRQALSDRITSQREMYFAWSDTQPRRLFQVSFIDAAGRRAMNATVGNYQEVETGDNDRPLMPTEISVSWPQTGSWIRLKLSKMNITKGQPREACKLVPPGGVTVNDVDENIVMPAPAPTTSRSTK